MEQKQKGGGALFWSRGDNRTTVRRLMVDLDDVIIAQAALGLASRAQRFVVRPPRTSSVSRLFFLES
jgi:hypothetical protein